MVANAWYSTPTLARPGTATDGRTEIGILSPNYGLEHLSYLMDLPDYRHVLIRRLPLHRLERRGRTFIDKTPIVLRAPVPLIHTFNQLPVNGPPFVISFKFKVPFYLGPDRPWQNAIGRRILASPRCRGILALSETASTLVRNRFEAEGETEIAAKIHTFRGAVVPSRQSPAQMAARDDASRDSGPLRLIFVGADGLRKGIVPLLDAVEQLRQSGAEIELTVVSSMLERSYAVVSAAQDAPGVRRRLEETPWITYHRALPYEAVRAAMAEHDLLALPTLDETLGWVVIEAAMEGLGTVASNAFALPELVEDGVGGRVIDLPLNENLKWEGLFSEDRPAALAEAYDRLREGLVAALGEAVNNRARVREWGRNAHARLAALYDPRNAARELAGHYARALGRPGG